MVDIQAMLNSAWFQTASWPFDQDGKVFLARAINRLGLELCGSSWMGIEFATPALPPPLSRSEKLVVSTRWEAEAIHKTLTKAGRILPPFWPHHMVHSPEEIRKRGGYWPDVADILAAREIEAAAAEESRRVAAESLGRRAQVESLFLNCVISGRLQTYWQDPRSGSLDWHIPAANWNLPSRQSFLVHCRINPTAPHNPEPGQWAGYIFVDGATLDQIVAELKAQRSALEPRQPAPWWRAHREAVKTWARRPEVQAEALSRCDMVLTKTAFLGALKTMSEEGGEGAWRPDTIPRTFRDFPDLWPPDVS